ncbi:protein N-terminal asparagine amidohydrolase isoform X6 [Nematostella vectensis]|uniref:protein N-terminal asparagine amidohydrolase isoform X6 n=1 Tax=Nematostella vectensis TaxID=45351 RepID=UPI00207710DC|nr:protein N-terminal asparagine amidohydrolase isoform X6 [Nematostella vectensis]
MPLIVEGTLVDETISNINDLVKRFPLLKARSDSLIRQACKDVGKAGLVYVHQREYATVTTQDENIHIIGSGDATTCQIIVLQEKDSGVTCLAHLDGSEMEEAVSSMVQSIQGHSSVQQDPLQIDVHIAGGFLDKRGISQQITRELLGILLDQKSAFHLQTAAVTDLNDSVRDGVHYPIVYGIAVDVRSGRIFNASFPDKRPDSILRHARNFTGNKRIRLFHQIMGQAVDKVEEIYNSKDQELRIRPFHHQHPMNNAAFFATAPREIILKENDVHEREHRCLKKYPKRIHIVLIASHSC